MENSKEEIKRIYFYYRYCETTKRETFIGRETPITDDVEKLYSSYPSDEEVPLGTIFAIACMLLEDILVPVSVEDSINNMTDVLDKLTGIDNIRETLKVFILMSFLKKDYCNMNENENASIYSLNFFLEECAQNITYTTNDYLEKIILMHDIPFPKADKIVVDYSYIKPKKTGLSGNMKNFLDESLPYQNMWEKLFEDVPKYKFHYYEVDTMSGLIITLLSVIFDNRKIIKVCEHCYNYFVPQNRSDEKYCITNRFFGNQDCKMAVRVEQQRGRIALRQGDTDKMEHSVRTMLYYRARQALPKNQISEKQFEKYKEQINNFKTKIKKGESTVEEYRDFLKTFYKKGVKY